MQHASFLHCRSASKHAIPDRPLLKPEIATLEDSRHRLVRSFNLKFIVLLGTLLAAVGTGLHLLHGVQIRRSARVLIQQAEQKLAEGDLPAAVGYLQRYVKLAPEDLEAKAKLGIALADVHRLDPARRTLQRVVQQDPQRHAERTRLAEVSIRLGHHADAKTHLAEHLLPQSPHDPQLHSMLAECHAALGEYKLAVAALDEATKQKPDDISLYTRAAAILRDELDQADKATATINAMVEANPQSASAYLARAQYREHQDLSAARADLATALDITPDDEDIIFFAFQLATRADDLDVAREYLRHGEEVKPDDARWYLSRAQLEADSGQRDRAMETLQRGLEMLPGQVDLVWNLADMQMEAGRVSEARELIEQLERQDFHATPLEYLRAREEIHGRQWREASRRLHASRAAMSDWPELARQADYWLGVCHQQLGNPDLQLGAFRRALQVDPGWTPARLGVAAALASLGRLDEAIDEYRQILASEGRIPAGSYLHMARLTVLQQLQVRQQDRDWQQVDRVLDNAEKVLPDAVEVPILRAEALLARGDVDAAANLLEKVLVEQPEVERFWVAVAGVEQRRQKWDRAKDILDEAQRRLGSSVPLVLARIRYLVQRHGKKSRPQLVKLEGVLDRFSETDRVKLAGGLADALYFVGDWEAAGRLWQRVADAEPENIRVRLFLFDLALSRRDEPRMGRLLDEIRQIEGGQGGPLTLLGEAIRAVHRAHQGDLEALAEARDHLERARMQRPAWSRIPLLESEIDEIEQDRQAATKHYLQAIELGERNPQVVRRTVQLLYQQGRYNLADEVLRKLDDKETPLSPALSRLASEVSMRVEQYGRALALAQRNAEESADYQDHIWLGQILDALEQPAEARASYRQAVELAPDEPEAWIALVRHFVRHEQWKPAEAAVAQIEKRMEGKRLPLVLAQCYDAMQRVDEAHAQFKLAAEAAPTDVATLHRVAEFYLRTARNALAEPILRRMTAGELAVEPGLQRWARRNLALIYAGRGDYPGLQEAIGLLDENLLADKQSVEDRRAKAAILSTRSGKHAREEAIGLLQSIVDARKSITSDRYLLASLYQKSGNWPEATRQMRRVLAAENENVDYLVTYIRNLIDRNETSEALLWLNRLRSIQPDALKTKSLQARVLVRRGRIDQAVELLHELAESRQGEQQPSSPIVVGRLAEHLMLDAQNEAARAELEKVADRYYRAGANAPGGRLAWGGYLARQGRFDEAFEQYDSCWDSADLEQVAAGCVDMAGYGKLNRQQMSRIESRLKAAARAQPDSIPLLLSLAEFCNIQQQYDQAIDVYRRVVSREGRHVVALNNLALLLVLSRGEAKDALEMINRALAVAGPSPFLLDSRAVILMALGRTDKALNDCRAATAEQPSSTHYFHLARAHHAAGESIAATEALEKATRSGLRPESLHPLERDTCRQLLAELLPR